MKKLEKLTSEQEEKMIEVRDFWLNYIFSCKNSIDKPKVKEGVKWFILETKKPIETIIYK